jgi:hypothetical protein
MKSWECLPLSYISGGIEPHLVHLKGHLRHEWEICLDGKFVERIKIKTHVPSTFLLEGRDYRGKIGVGTGKNNARFYQL